MKRFLMLLIVLAAVHVMQSSPRSLAATGFQNQERPDRLGAMETVIGEVVAVDNGARSATVKTDQGVILVMKVSGNATCLRVPVGETTLAKAVAIQFADIRVADRVLGHGLLSGDKKELDAERLIVVSKVDIEKRRERDLDEWQRRGIGGVVKALNPQTGEVHLETHGLGGTSRIVVNTEKCSFRRYAPASANFADATPAGFAELKIGDQLRALGDRSADGTSFKAEQIVSGSFQIVRCVVTEVDSAKNEIKARTLDQKQPVIVSIGKGSALYRIPPELAAAIAKAALSARSGNAASAPAKHASGQIGQGLGEQKERGAGATNEPLNVQQMIDRLPSLALTSIKAGDVIAVVVTSESDKSPVTAIRLLAGIDTILNALKAPSGKRQVIALSAGLPVAAFDFGSP